MASFTAQVKAFGDKANKAMLATFRESAQRLAEQANTPIAQGGKTPVDTGFLRASMGGASGSMPMGPTKGLADQKYSSPVGEPVQLAILRTQLGDKLYIGWTAMYAPMMDVRYGFMRSAAQNWDGIVQNVAVEVAARIK